MTWFVVANPSAGTGVDPAGVARALRRAGVTHEMAVPGSIEEARSAVARAVAAGHTRFVAVGGDGTANVVVDELFAVRTWPEPPMLALVPTGSGSDFARTFALPPMEEAVARLADAEPYRCDVGLLTGAFGRRHFLNAANVGIAAASARRAGRLPARLGGIRYTLAFWLTLPRFPPGPATITTSRGTVAGQVMNVVVANGQFFGGGLNVAPRASPADGMLDIQVFLGPRRNAFSVMPRLVRGHHLGHRAVRRLVAAEATIEVPAHWPVEADGEVIGRGAVRVEILPGALELGI